MLARLRRFVIGAEDKRLDLVIAAALFAASFCVYLRTMRPSFGWGDSAELTTAAYHLGIGHSPGYPTYMLLGYLFSHLPIGTVAFRMNLMSVFFGALAIALSYFVFRHIARTRLGAILGAAAFAFTATIWDLTTEAEVYTLHAAFVAAIILCLLDWARCGKPRPAWIALLCGLSLGNHALTALLLPGILIFAVWQKGLRHLRWQPIAFAAFAFLLGVSVYSYLLIRGPANAPPNINNPHTLHDVYIHITAPCYRDIMFKAPPLQVAGRLWVYGARLKREVSWAGIVLGLVGLPLLWRRERKLTILLILLAAPTIFYAANYSIFDIYCYFVTSYWVWCALIGVGGEFAVALGCRLLQKLQGRQDSLGPGLRRALVGAVALVLPFWLLTGHWKMVDASHDREPEKFARATFSLVEKNSLILGDWWAIAPLGYLKHIEGMRSDVTLSPAFSLSTKEASERHLERKFLRRFPAVYATEVLTYGMNELRKRYLLVPQGPVSRVMVDGPQPELARSDFQGKPRILFGNRLALIGWQIEPKQAGPVEMVAISLYWQSLQPRQVGQQYDVTVALEQGPGKWAWREKTPLAHGLFPMESWREGQTLVERRLVYPDSDLPAGEYRLSLRVRQRNDGNRLLPALSPAGTSLGKDAQLGEVALNPAPIVSKVAHSEARTASATAL